MSILVLGTVALDDVLTPSGQRKNLLGGSAVHFSLAARFFTHVSLVAVVGKDFPQRHIAFLRQKGICLESLLSTPAKTFHWSGAYEGDLNTARTLKTELGALLDFQPVVRPEQRRIKNVFLANYDPQLQSALLAQMHSPGLVALDTMNYWIKHKPKQLFKLFKQINIFVANDQEARELSGQNNLVRAAKYLRKLGPQMILIKKGEHGVLFSSDKLIFSLPAYPVERVVDPTGAGDSFAGGFFGYLARRRKINKRDIKEALALGTVIASFNIEDFGVSRVASLSLADFQARLRKFKKMVCF